MLAREAGNAFALSGIVEALAGIRVRHLLGKCRQRGLTL